MTRGLARITVAALTMACLSGTGQAVCCTLTRLGDLPGGSAASGINDAGQVLGDSTATGGGRAFLWDALNGMQNLIDPGLRAVLRSAKAINASGQIVGAAITDGRWEQAFLLTPISEVLAPAALPLMFGETGLLVALVRRTSKHVAHPATSASPSDKLGA